MLCTCTPALCTLAAHAHSPLAQALPPCPHLSPARALPTCSHSSLHEHSAHTHPCTSTPNLLFSSCMSAPALLTLTPSTSTPTLLTLTPAQAFPPCSHTLCTHPLTLHAQYTYSCLAHPLTSQMCTHGLSVRLHPPCTHTLHVCSATACPITPCPHTLPRAPARALHTCILVHIQGCLPGMTTLQQPPNMPLPSPTASGTSHPFLHPWTPNLAHASQPVGAR